MSRWRLWARSRISGASLFRLCRSGPGCVQEVRIVEYAERVLREEGKKDGAKDLLEEEETYRIVCRQDFGRVCA